MDHGPKSCVGRGGKGESVALGRRFSGLFLALFLSLAAILPPAAVAAEVPPGKKGGAKPAGEQAVPLERRLAQLADTRDRLKAFLSGEKLIDVPPAALFTVDLSNEEAVRHRVQELAESLSAVKEGKRATPEERIRRLEAEIDRLRLTFLSLPKERREMLVAAQQAGLAQSETAEQLARERSTAQQEKAVATRSLEAAEEQAKTAKSASLRDLAAQRAVLEKTRQKLAALAIQWTSSLQERAKFYQETTEKLSSLAGVLVRNESPGKIQEAYHQDVEIWRGLVDRIFSHISDPERYEPVPEVPAFSQNLADRLSGEPEAEAYRGAYEEILQQHRSLGELREKRFREERDSLYRLLLHSGKLRSQLLRECIRTGKVSRFSFSTAYLKDLIREIRIVPYRWIAVFYSKLMDFRAKSASGFSGFLAIAWQILLFLLLIAVPFAIFRLLRYLGKALDRTRSNLIGASSRVPWAGGAALFVQRVNPYFPWVVMLIVVWFAKRLVEYTDLPEIGAILPYLTYYIGYRIFRILVASIVNIVAYSGALHGLAADQDRIQRTTKRLGIFFFLALATLHATETVVGKALVYNILSALMLYLGAVLCAHAARQWRREIGMNAERFLPETIAGWLKSLCLGSLSSWLVCLPVLALLSAVMAFHWIVSWASRFDFIKRIAAEIFRRRIGGARREKEEAAPKPPEKVLPEEYLRWFDLYAPVDPALLIEPENGIVDSLRSMIHAWEEEQTEEHTAGIYGDKGAGKSSLLQVLQKEFGGMQILSGVVPPKLCTREAVFAFFGNLLQADLSKGAGALADRFSGGKKTVLLVDDAHNLFLAALGGVEGCRAMIDLISARTKTLFWCAAFNRRSWHYLSGVFGKNHYFRNHVEVPPWSDSDIRNLIMTRHRKTSLRLSYDAIIRATHSLGDYAGVAELETQFFRLLWNQSRGNPRAALLMWITSLTPANGGDLRVGIPQLRQQRALEDAGDDPLFVYTAIIRHENLSTDEIVTTTNLPEGIVRHALRVGMENSAIIRSADGRYRVTPEAQFFLSQLLERKNFLYE